MELILKTNLETEIPAVIDWNHEALKAELSERLEHYKNLVVTEDAISAAKADRAKLNSLRTAIDDKRKQVKKDCLRPYEDFEKKVKEIMALIDEPISAIDAQTKAFDEIQRNEKLSTLTAYYSANIGELRELLPIERVLPSKWANKGEKILPITQEMFGTIQKVGNDIKIIRAMKLPFEQNVLDVYIRTLDMSAALAEKSRMEEQAERLKKLAEADLERRQNDQLANATAPIMANPVDEPATAPQSVPASPQEVERTKDIDVRFYATTASFRADMKALADKHGIKYGRVN